MQDHLARMWENLAGRISGPMKFRLLLQPTMALFFAIRSGLKDAREGKPAYFWALLTNPGERRAMLHDGWKSLGKVFVAALVIDVIYQVIALRWVYPGEAVLVATILALVPYLLVRGPVNRIARRPRNAVKEREIGG